MLELALADARIVSVGLGICLGLSFRCMGILRLACLECACWIAALGKNRFSGRRSCHYLAFSDMVGRHPLAKRDMAF